MIPKIKTTQLSRKLTKKIQTTSPTTVSWTTLLIIRNVMFLPLSMLVNLGATM
uniref:Uncharacterized protein n=1 Tax=Arundo donax TaxID=35708 RepID=A0A0A9FF86_ARUDO